MNKKTNSQSFYSAPQVKVTFIHADLMFAASQTQYGASRESYDSIDFFE